jgi:hypothetical protein
MITHIVFWRLNENANQKSKQENAAIIKEKLAAVAEKVEGVISVEVGYSYNHTAEASDVALILKCRDKEVLNSYDGHPEHQAFKEWIKDIRYERRVVDFES